MAFRVYNALGGTAEAPCPTAGGGEFCSLGDVRSWREAAARLYERAILPSWQALVELTTTAPTEGDAVQLLHERVASYASAFNKLPGGSMWSAEKNRESVTDIVALMQSGDQLVDDLGAAIEATGNPAPAVLLPAPPETPVMKHPWSRWLLPAGAVGGVLVVIGLSAAAAVSYRNRRRLDGEGGAKRGKRAA